MFLHSDLLKLCLKKKHNITDLLPDTTVFTIRKLVLRGNRVKRWRDIKQSNCIIHMFDLRKTLPKYLRTLLNEFEDLTNFSNGPIILEY